MVEAYVQEDREEIEKKIKLVRSLQETLSKKVSFKEKASWVLSQKEVRDFLQQLPSSMRSLSDEDLFIIGLLVLSDQADTLLGHFEGDFQAKISATLSMLQDTERFYASIGGLLGYIEKTLQKFCGDEKKQADDDFIAPPFYDMREKTNEVWATIYEGIKRLPEMGEIYTVGGAGDRLKLLDEGTGLPVPVAYLNFCGRPLFEYLFRDLEAREFFYFTCFGRQIVTPILLMTSQEKGNDKAIGAIVEKFQFFGRDKKTVLRVVQPLVPLIASNGKLVFQKPLELAGKPGGHGVIWKIAHDTGAFSWLKQQGVTALLVRQINNPLSGLDHTLSALVGFGLSANKAFGFASCPRRKGFAEGLNVALIEKKRLEATISNIEYTRFGQLSAEEAKALEQQEIPANTNILFARIDAIEEALEKDAVPGLTVNAKNQCEIISNGKSRTLSAARLESTMQNIADVMMKKVSSFDPESMKKELSTFLQLYERSKLISVTKNAYNKENPRETPESCFYDWIEAGRRILEKECGFSLPEQQSFVDFLRDGPSILFFFHPALGPFWEIISQKLRAGRLFPGAELELEIAEVYIEDISLTGSFRLLADSPTGCKDAQGIRRYSKDVPRAYIKGVSIVNKGVLPASISDHVKRQVCREESCTIRLEGVSELIMENVSLSGDFTLVVPHGKRAIISEDAQGELNVRMEECSLPSWNYQVIWDGLNTPKLHYISHR